MTIETTRVVPENDISVLLPEYELYSCSPESFRTHDFTDKRLVFLTGVPGVGKDIVCSALSNYGIKSDSFGDHIVRLAALNGGNINRNNLSTNPMLNTWINLAARDIFNQIDIPAIV